MSISYSNHSNIMPWRLPIFAKKIPLSTYEQDLFYIPQASSTMSSKTLTNHGLLHKQLENILCNK